MDLKKYYRKMREIEASLTEEYLILVSLETPDGGKPGVLSEVSRANAARMLVEGRATLASPEQVEQYHAQIASAQRAAEKAEMAKRIQFAIIPESELPGSTKRGGLTPNGK